MKLMDIIKEREVQKNYDDAVVPYRAEIDELKTQKELELEYTRKMIERKYEREILNKTMEMAKNCGSVPRCDHPLFINLNVISGDYFDKAHNVSYCLCCNRMIEPILSMIKETDYVKISGVYNEEEAQTLITLLENELTTYHTLYPNASIYEVRNMLRGTISQNRSR